MLNAIIGDMKTTGHVNITDHCMINDDGWVCGRNGELLMWIPPLNRIGLHHPANIWLAGKCETVLDLSTFVHGQRWSACIDVNGLPT